MSYGYSWSSMDHKENGAAVCEMGWERSMLFQKGLHWECTWIQDQYTRKANRIVSQKPTTVVQFAAGLVRDTLEPQHPLPTSSCSSQGIEELRPRPASIFLWSLPSYAFFCNVIEETLQLRSSSYHLFKQFSLYLHAWPINVFTNDLSL